MENNYRSKEEWYFSLYLEELVINGYVDKWWYEPKAFILSEPVTYKWIKETQLKTKIRKENKESTFLRGHEYTPDFVLRWTDLGKYTLWSTTGLTRPFYADSKGYSFVDTKGVFNRHESSVKFRINQKWLWDKLGIYVQEIVPSKLFAKTFTPNRYLRTDGDTKKRSFKWKAVSLKEYFDK